MSQHTPGPWSTDLVVTTQSGRVAIEPDVAIVYIQPSRYDLTLSKTRLANARLIAAAPELLSACDKLVDDAVPDRDENGDPDISHVDFNNLYEAARLARYAVAKATGKEVQK